MRLQFSQPIRDKFQGFIDRGRLHPRHTLEDLFEKSQRLALRMEHREAFATVLRIPDGDVVWASMWNGFNISIVFIGGNAGVYEICTYRTLRTMLAKYLHMLRDGKNPVSSHELARYEEIFKHGWYLKMQGAGGGADPRLNSKPWVQVENARRV